MVNRPTSDEIRSRFLRFFEEHGHLVLPSASLIPQGDPTLLLTTAGMVPFKPYFLGEAEPPRTRITTVQKCIRTTDIEEVGDLSHLTFFEMLGNFSFGDYFKAEAIDYAWALLTTSWDQGGYGLAPQRLWITVHVDDDEAERLWLEHGVPPERIRRFDEENFWDNGGHPGPCGPDSELHFDFGAERCREKHSEAQLQSGECGPNLDCGRFLELWNLVFIQYNQDRHKKRTPLARKNIDTGMGLDRLTTILQGAASPFETDLFEPIIGKVVELTRRNYHEGDEETKRAIRVVAEHARAATFLIADGLIPGNEGRGYVLRRLIRRAVRYGRMLGLEQAFLGDTGETIITGMAEHYPELVGNKDFILRALSGEEERFSQTLEQGIALLENELIPTRKLIKEMADRWAQEVQTVFENREPESWHALIDGPFERVKSELISAVLLFSPTPALQNRQHWLRGVVARRFLESLERESSSIKLKLDNAFQSAMRDTGTQNLADPRTSQLARQRASDLLTQLQHHIQTLRDEARTLQETITGREVFVLSDTYGFPSELTSEIASEHGLNLDLEGYATLVAEQRERSRATSRFTHQDEAIRVNDELDARLIPGSRFVGYETLTHESEIREIRVGGHPMNRAYTGAIVEVILRETPFYAEGGGQVGDAGEIRGPAGRILVEDTQSPIQGVIVHKGRLVEGSISVGEVVTAEVTGDRHWDTMRHHTATHLLQSALRAVLGTHVLQHGSLVAPDRLRFDFSHLAALTSEEIASVESWVNRAIRENLPVEPRYLPYAEALQAGAIALFGEKYSAEVRMMDILREDGVLRDARDERTDALRQAQGERSDEHYHIVSRELCGGTHVHRTGDIGVFVILSEASIGAGMRRIEALAGRPAEEWIRQQRTLLEQAARAAQASPADLPQRVAALQDEAIALRRRIGAIESQRSRDQASTLLERVRNDVDGVLYLAEVVEAPSMEALKTMGEEVRQRLGSGVLVLAALFGGQPSFLAMVTPDLVAKGYHAGNLIRSIAQEAGGSGGGRPELGQGGGRDPARLEQALQAVPQLLQAVQRASERAATRRSE